MSFNIIEKFKENSAKNRLKNRDQSAFEELYDKNIDDIYRFIYFKIGKKDEASDLSSLVFLKTWEHIRKNSISNKETLRGLVYKIARNVVIDYYRSNKGENLSLDDEANKIDVVDDKYDIESQMSDQADFGGLMSRMMELKNEYREVLLMRFVSELSIDEISDITGKKKINVRVLLHRAIKALREIVEEND